MTLNVSKTVDHLRVHMKDLEILSTVLSLGTTDIKIRVNELRSMFFRNVSEFGNLWQDTLVYGPNEFLIVRLGTPLESGQYKLVIQFRGSLTRGIVGLYRSQYTDPGTNITQ